MADTDLLASPTSSDQEDPDKDPKNTKPASEVTEDEETVEEGTEATGVEVARPPIKKYSEWLVDDKSPIEAFEGLSQKEAEVAADLSSKKRYLDYWRNERLERGEYNGDETETELIAGFNEAIKPYEITLEEGEEYDDEKVKAAAEAASVFADVDSVGNKLRLISSLDDTTIQRMDVLSGEGEDAVGYRAKAQAYLDYLGRKPEDTDDVQEFYQESINELLDSTDTDELNIASVYSDKIPFAKKISQDGDVEYVASPLAIEEAGGIGPAIAQSIKNGFLSPEDAVQVYKYGEKDEETGLTLAEVSRASEIEAIIPDVVRGMADDDVISNAMLSYGSVLYQADAVLAKADAEGEDSLTESEKSVLESFEKERDEYYEALASTINTSETAPVGFKANPEDESFRKLADTYVYQYSQANDEKTFITEGDDFSGNIKKNPLTGDKYIHQAALYRPDVFEKSMVDANLTDEEKSALRKQRNIFFDEVRVDGLNLLVTEDGQNFEEYLEERGGRLGIFDNYRKEIGEKRSEKISNGELTFDQAASYYPDTEAPSYGAVVSDFLEKAKPDESFIYGLGFLEEYAFSPVHYVTSVPLLAGKLPVVGDAVKGSGVYEAAEEQSMRLVRDNIKKMESMRKLGYVPDWKYDLTVGAGGLLGQISSDYVFTFGVGKAVKLGSAAASKKAGLTGAKKTALAKVTKQLADKANLTKLFKADREAKRKALKEAISDAKGKFPGRKLSDVGGVGFRAALATYSRNHADAMVQVQDNPKTAGLPLERQREIAEDIADFKTGIEVGLTSVFSFLQMDAVESIVLKGASNRQVKKSIARLGGKDRITNKQFANIVGKGMREVEKELGLARNGLTKVIVEGTSEAIEEGAPQTAGVIFEDFMLNYLEYDPKAENEPMLDTWGKFLKFSQYVAEGNIDSELALEALKSGGYDAFIGGTLGTSVSGLRSIAGRVAPSRTRETAEAARAAQTALAERLSDRLSENGAPVTAEVIKNFLKTPARGQTFDGLTRAEVEAKLAAGTLTQEEAVRMGLARPAAEPVTEAAAEPAAEPTAEPTPEPTAAPAEEAAAEPTPEAAAEPPTPTPVSQIDDAPAVAPETRVEEAITEDDVDDLIDEAARQATEPTILNTPKVAPDTKLDPTTADHETDKAATGTTSADLIPASLNEPKTDKGNKQADTVADEIRDARAEGARVVFVDDINEADATLKTARGGQGISDDAKAKYKNADSFHTVVDGTPVTFIFESKTQKKTAGALRGIAARAAKHAAILKAAGRDPVVLPSEATSKKAARKKTRYNAMSDTEKVLTIIDLLATPDGIQLDPKADAAFIQYVRELAGKLQDSNTKQGDLLASSLMSKGFDPILPPESERSTPNLESRIRNGRAVRRFNRDKINDIADKFGNRKESFLRFINALEAALSSVPSDIPVRLIQGEDTGYARANDGVIEINVGEWFGLYNASIDLDLSVASDFKKAVAHMDRVTDEEVRHIASFRSIPQALFNKVVDGMSDADIQYIINTYLGFDRNAKRKAEDVLKNGTPDQIKKQKEYLVEEFLRQAGQDRTGGFTTEEALNILQGKDEQQRTFRQVAMDYLKGMYRRITNKTKMGRILSGPERAALARIQNELSFMQSDYADPMPYGYQKSGTPTGLAADAAALEQFAGAPVVAEQGKEYTVYRGKSKHIGPREERRKGVYSGEAHGVGEYFGLTPEAAERFSRAGTVEESKVTLNNPLVLSSDEEVAEARKKASEISGYPIETFYAAPMDGPEAVAFTSAMQSLGYDGVLITFPEAPGGEQLIVFPKEESILYAPSYGIVDAVNDINAGNTDTPLRSLNKVVEEAQELRDRQQKESKRRAKPRRRGKAAIMERVSRARAAGEIQEETAQAITQFVNSVKDETIGDTAISIRKEGVSNYDFTDNLISFFLTQDTGDFGASTAIHEFWHGLSRFLPDAEANKIKKRYFKELNAYVEKNPWYYAFVGRKSLSPRQFEEYKTLNPEEAATKLTPVYDEAGDIVRYDIKFDKENYRYSMLDEFIAETMADLVTRKQKAPDTFLGQMAKVIREFLDLIKAKLGRDPFERFYQSVTNPLFGLEKIRQSPVAPPSPVYEPTNYRSQRFGDSESILYAPPISNRDARDDADYMDAIDRGDYDMAEEALMRVGERYGVTDPELIFRDNDGNIMTPSQRFMTPPSVLAPEKIARHKELEAKYNAGTLTPEEEQEAGRIVEEAAQGAGFDVEGWHATSSDRFDRFDNKKAGSGPISGNPIVEHGFFFAPDESGTELYQTDGGQVLRFFLKFKKPFDFDMFGEGAKLSTPQGLADADKYRDRINQIKKKGYDGLRLTMDGEVRELMAFNPNQIKSADPFTGVPIDERFDPGSESILYTVPFLADVQGGDAVNTDVEIDINGLLQTLNVPMYHTNELDLGNVVKRAVITGRISDERVRNMVIAVNRFAKVMPKYMEDYEKRMRKAIKRLNKKSNRAEDEPLMEDLRKDFNTAVGTEDIFVSDDKLSDIQDELDKDIRTIRRDRDKFREPKEEELKKIQESVAIGNPDASPEELSVLVELKFKERLFNEAREKATQSRLKAFKDAAEAKKVEVAAALARLEKNAPELAQLVIDVRQAITDISQFAMESGIPMSDDLKMTFDATQGFYLSRRYRFFNDPAYRSALLEEAAIGGTPKNFQKEIEEALPVFEENLRRETRQKLFKKEARKQLSEGKITANQLKNQEVQRNINAAVDSQIDQEIGDIDKATRAALIEYLESYGNRRDQQYTEHGVRIVDSILKNKKNLPEPIRNLLGQYKSEGDMLDGFRVMLQTVGNQTAMLASAMKLQNLKTINDEIPDVKNRFILTEDQYKKGIEDGSIKSGEFSEWDNKSGSMSKADPLKGMYVQTELAEALNAKANKFDYASATQTERGIHVIGGFVGFFTGMSMMSVTGLSGAAYYFRNSIGNLFRAINSGQFTDPRFLGSFLVRSMAEGAAAVPFVPAKVRYIPDKISSLLNGESVSLESLQSEHYKLQSLGVIDQSLNAASLRDMFNPAKKTPSEFYAKLEQLDQSSAVGRLTKKGVVNFFNYIQKLQNSTDNAYKLSTYYRHKRLLEKAKEEDSGSFRGVEISKMDEYDIDREAALMMNKITPGEDYLIQSGEYITQSWLRYIAGPFTRFRTEVARTYVNMIGETYRLLKSGNPVLRGEGGRRLVGLIAMHGISFGPATWLLSSLLGGFDQEEQDVLDEANPFFFSMAQLIRSRDGDVVTDTNFTYMNEMALFGDSFSYAMQKMRGGESAMEAALGAASVFLLREVLGEQILAGAIQDLRDNKDGFTGQKIYRENDDAFEKGAKSLEYIYKRVRPATLRGIEEAMDAYEVADGEKESKIDAATKAFLGRSVFATKPFSDTLQNKMSKTLFKYSKEKDELDRDKSRLSQELKSGVTVRKPTQSQIDELANDYIKDIARLLDDVDWVVKGYQKMGVSKEDIKKYLNESYGMAKPQVDYYMRTGNFVLPYFSTGQEKRLDAFEDQEDASARRTALQNALREYATPDTGNIRIYTPRKAK